MSDGSSAPKSGVRTVLGYTGIPPSWLDKRPSLPSRNWLIFLSITGSFAGCLIYDRWQCKRIRQEYAEKVKHLSEEVSNDHLATLRKVKVYGCQWPGDDDHDVSLKYFRKYVKPMLVAAAVDYDMVNGKRHGDLANQIAEEIKARRREDLGLETHVPSALEGLDKYRATSTQEKRALELQGGIVVVGRPAWKEFMVGLKRGWTESPEKIDYEEKLAQNLADDGAFDEVSENAHESVSSESPTSLGVSEIFSQQQGAFSSPAASPETSSLSYPPSLPPLPPILLVSFMDYLGFTQVPIMIWDWLNQRRKVREGSEAGYRIVMAATRPINGPRKIAIHPEQGGDLDFDLPVESWYRSYLSHALDDIDYERKKYYKELPARLKTTRDIVRGIREPTSDEEKHPPKSEMEIRAERLKKEKRWLDDAKGWMIVRPGEPVVWDDRFRDLKIFTDPDTK